MFGFGSFSHILVILVLALILIGPKQLPEVARALGRLLTELRRASNILTDEFRQQMREDEKQNQIQPHSPPAPTTPPTNSEPSPVSSPPSDQKSEEKKI